MPSAPVRSISAAPNLALRQSGLCGQVVRQQRGGLVGPSTRWVPQTDPYGVVHNIIDYPDVPVDHSIVQENHNILKNVRIPIRPHFGVMGVAPNGSGHR
jgi:hypothetical protein